MKRLILPMLALLSFAACQQGPKLNISPPAKFSTYGVSFAIPDDWTVTDRKVVEDGMGYTVTLEKNGSNSSGMVTVNWLNLAVDEMDIITAHQDEIRERLRVLSAEVEYGAISDRQYNGIDCKQSAYTFTLQGVKHQGRLVAFVAPERSFAILYQEANVDTAANAPGFTEIEKSFSNETPDTL